MDSIDSESNALLAATTPCKNENISHLILNFRIREEEHHGTKRRQAMFQMAFTALSFPAMASAALAQKDIAEDFRAYTDDVNKFKISIPRDWQVGTGEPNGFKFITAFYLEEEASTSNGS